MTFNPYGDKKVDTLTGHGVDIASQRADDLDAACLAQITKLKCERTPDALDIGCGQGGQSVRMAAAGAHVTAVDIDDYSTLISESSMGLPGSITFLQSDMLALTQALPAHRFDVIICQRAIHYLPYGLAKQALEVFRQLLAPDGRLYLSASGLHSELGDGYEGKSVPISARFHPLHSAMATKHNIHPEVCLYSQAELAALLQESGFVAEKVYQSTFGNIKSISRIGA